MSELFSGFMDPVTAMIYRYIPCCAQGVLTSTTPPNREFSRNLRWRYIREFLSYTSDQVVKNYFHVQENRLARIIWARSRKPLARPLHAWKISKIGFLHGLRFGAQRAPVYAHNFFNRPINTPPYNGNPYNSTQRGRPNFYFIFLRKVHIRFFLLVSVKQENSWLYDW